MVPTIFSVCPELEAFLILRTFSTKQNKAHVYTEWIWQICIKLDKVNFTHAMQLEKDIIGSLSWDLYNYSKPFQNGFISEMLVWLVPLILDYDSTRGLACHWASEVDKVRSDLLTDPISSLPAAGFHTWEKDIQSGSLLCPQCLAQCWHLIGAVDISWMNRMDWWATRGIQDREWLCSHEASILSGSQTEEV